MTEKRITTPLTKDKVEGLKAGDSVLITGTIYTARDAAHERMVQNYEKGEPFPIDLTDNVIYYAGPCPAKPGEVIGSCGPTTAGRMDAYTPLLLDKGLGCMIGKGARSADVVDAMRRNCVVYLGAVGGAGALIARQIKSAEEIAFKDLGCESIKRLYVEKLPLTAAVDSSGADIFTLGRGSFGMKRHTGHN